MPQGWNAARPLSQSKTPHCVSAVVSNKCAVSRAILLSRLTVRKHQKPPALSRRRISAWRVRSGGELGTNLFVCLISRGRLYTPVAVQPIPSHGHQSSPDFMLPILLYRGMTGAADLCTRLRLFASIHNMQQEVCFFDYPLTSLTIEAFQEHETRTQSKAPSVGNNLEPRALGLLGAQPSHLNPHFCQTQSSAW